MVGEQGFAKLGFDHELGAAALASMPHDLAQLGLQWRRLAQGPPPPALGPQRIGENEGIESIVLAHRGLVALTSPRRDSGTDWKHGDAVGVEFVDDGPVDYEAR